MQLGSKWGGDFRNGREDGVEYSDSETKEQVELSLEKGIISCPSLFCDTCTTVTTLYSLQLVCVCATFFKPLYREISAYVSLSIKCSEFVSNPEKTTTTI